MENDGNGSRSDKATYITARHDKPRAKDTIKIGTHIDLFEIGLHAVGNDFESSLESRFKNSVIENCDSKDSDELKINEFFEEEEKNQPQHCTEYVYNNATGVEVMRHEHFYLNLSNVISY